MEDKKDVILNEKDQKLSNPVTETKQADPSTAQNELALRNGKFDEKDTNAGDKTEAKGKTETADKANQMSDSPKAKTDTTATSKFNNPFQKEKEAADNSAEAARVLLDRVKQSESKVAKKYTDSTFSKDKSFSENWKTFFHSTDPNSDKELLELEKETEDLAKALGIDIGSLSTVKTVGDTITPARARKLKEIYKELAKVAEERLAAAKTKQQKAQANYTKAEEEEAAKRKAEEEAAKKKESEPATKDQKVQDEVLDEKVEALDKVLERAEIRRGELDEEWDKLLEDNEKELDKHKDAAELANFLPRFAIQHYLEGDFGERKTAKALGTLGYFLLDKIGASMVNASQVARGMSPTQKTALEQYNTKMMEAAINRDDKNRSKLNEEKINTIIKNSDALRAAGYDTEVKLTNDMVSKYLEQHADQVDEMAYMRLKKQAADWYNNLTDAEKMEVDRLFLAMSTNPDERQRGILQYQLSGYEVLGQTDEAKKQQAKYAQAEAKAKTKTIDKLTRAQLARAEQEIENMKKDGMLTEAQAADAWKMVELHQKDLNWRDAQEWQKQVTGYLNTATNAVGNVLKILK